jgi:hypothetical protein
MRRIIGWAAGTMLAVAGIVAPVTASAGPANQVYDFVGNCTDCTGTGTGVLTLSGSYVRGTTLTSGDFVDWTYTSNLITYEIASVTFISGSIPVSLPASVADVTFYNASYDFTTSGFIGTWCTGTGTLCFKDYGPTYTWSSAQAAPEPASLAVMAVGMVAVGATRRRRAAPRG